MKITYDQEADVLYIQLREVTPTDSTDLEEGITADLDAEGHVIGLEVLDARLRLGESALANFALERFPLTISEH